MRKKITLVLSFVLILLLLSGCYEGEITSMTEINSKDGAGTKTITCTVYKQNAVNSKGEVVDKDQADNNQLNMTMMKDNPEAIYNWLKDNAPEGVTVTWENKSDRVLFHLSWTFSSFEDYIAKNKKLAGDSWNENLHNTVFTATEVDGGTKITMKEEIDTTHTTIWWAIKGIHESGLLDVDTDNDGVTNFTVDQITEPWSWTVKIGNGEPVETAWVAGILGKDRTEAYIEAEGIVPNNAANTTKPAETTAPATKTDASNPVTSDTGIYILVIAAISALVLIITVIASRRVKE